MKKLFIVANWKSNKTINEAKEWLEKIAHFQFPSTEEREVIVCPSFTLLPSMKSAIAEKQLPLLLGAQNVSNFDSGAYTGEVNVKQASEFVTHAIVGHSERRRLMHETDEDIIAKVKQLFGQGLTPVLCISDMSQLDHYLAESNVLKDNAEKIIFVYEPPSAISGGGAYHPDSPEDANKNAAEISNKIGRRVTTLYGGSINPDNAASLFSQEYIDGGLVGQASLDPESFIKLIQSS